jgi:predicted O-methyltransferase YrrM
VNFQFGDGLKVIPKLDQRFDFVFLDAQKGNYHLFWDLIKTKIYTKSVIVVDNVIKFSEKTAKFSEKMKKEEEFSYQILPLNKDDGIMVIIPNPKPCSFEKSFLHQH